ncbi:MAG: hypothetical protein LQ351_003541 [Letrouitia transgressa]|nr:MAG: hypothetical protein LQ351_003541 [Letrouitia transgressa]
MRLLPYYVEQGEIDIAGKNEARRMGDKRSAADPMLGSFDSSGDEYSDKEPQLPASHSSGPSPWLSRLKSIFNRFISDTAGHATVNPENLAEIDNDAQDTMENQADDNTQDIAEDQEDGEFESTIVTANMLHLCKDVLQKRPLPETQRDPRMADLSISAYSWVLRAVGVMVGSIRIDEANDPELAGKAQHFRVFLEKSVSQLLNPVEKKEFSKLFQEIVEWCMGQMDVVVATSQTASKQVNYNLFSAIINDEATMTREAELLPVWRDPSQVVVLVRDREQLQPTIVSSKDKNPFAACIGLPPLERFIRAGLPFLELRESQRMVSGLMDMTNELLYNNRLRPGPNTSIEQRPLAAAVRQAVNDHFKGLKEEPAGMVYPCLLDVEGICHKEEQGTSRFNLESIAVVLQTIHWLLNTIPDLTADQIGIATTYSAQVFKYRKAIHRFHEDQPNLDILEVSVQTTEQFQGAQKEMIFADFVRAQNDHGHFGFLVENARLNVLTSRQMSALSVVFDCKALEIHGFEEFRQAVAAYEAWNDTYNAASNRIKQRMLDDEAYMPRRLRYKSLRNAHAEDFANFQETNKHLLGIVGWCEKRGRVIPAGNDTDDGET